MPLSVQEARKKSIKNSIFISSLGSITNSLYSAVFQFDSVFDHIMLVPHYHDLELQLILYYPHHLPAAINNHFLTFLPGQGKFECFSVSGCDNVTQGGGSTAEECCLGDGQFYRMSGGSAWQPCIGNY